MNLLIGLFADDSTEVRREIAYMFSNMCYNGNPAVLSQAYEQIVIVQYYVALLVVEDINAVESSLDGLYQVLKFGGRGRGENMMVMQLKGIEANSIKIL